MCVCETWSVVLKEERRLRVFENRVLKGTFKPNERILNNEELKDLYFPTNISRVIKLNKMIGWVCHTRRERCIQYFGRETW